MAFDHSTDLGLRMYLTINGARRELSEPRADCAKSAFLARQLPRTPAQVGDAIARVMCVQSMRENWRGRICACRECEADE
jgi:hypothetical protein